MESKTLTIEEARSVIATGKAIEGDPRNHGSRANVVAQGIMHIYETESRGNVERLQKLIGDWSRFKGFTTNWSNVPEKLMLIVTELSEAMESYRHISDPTKRHFSSKATVNPIPQSFYDEFVYIENFEEELADAAIRLLDLADGLGIDLLRNIYKKMAINELRPHLHGKQC